MKKKILYLITKGTWGGAQRYVFDLATNLPKDSFDVVVACGNSGTLTEKLQLSGIRHVLVPSLRRDIGIFSEVFALYGLTRLLHNERPDIIHLNSSKAAFLGVLASRCFLLLNFLTAKSYLPADLPARRAQAGASAQAGKPKAIFTVHGWPFKEPRSLFMRVCIWMASYLSTVLSSRTIVLSEGDLALARKMPGVVKKISLIYNGVRYGHSFQKTEARKKLGLPPDAKIIGTIAEQNRNKGIATLIEALSLLPNDIRLCLIGDGEEREKLEALSTTLGVKNRILFAGNCTEASAYLSAFDIFALPSIKEGLPYALLEAGLHGVPVVGSDIPGIQDIINTPFTGTLVPPENPKALARALKVLFEQEETRLRLGQNLKERVEHAFLFETMLKKTILAYGHV